jgi:hypothetical protein
MPKKKARHRKQRRELVELLVAEFEISPERADAIARRYGPSRWRCIAAAETLRRLKSLGLGS